MRRTQLLCILVQFSLVCSALTPFALGQETKPPTDAEIRESKVFDAIGEMIERRDKLLKQFAVVLHGEIIITGHDDLPIKNVPMVLARAVSAKRKFDLRAKFEVQSSKEEIGREVVREGDRYKGRTHTLLCGPYQEKPQGKRLSTWLENGTDAGGLDPFDDYVGGAASVYNSFGKNALEAFVRRDEKLVRTERGLGDHLISHWQREGEQLSTKTAIAFDPSQEMMPVKLEGSIDGMPHYFEEVNLTWTRYKNTLVPAKISVSMGEISDPNATYAFTFKCHWLIGDDVPNEIFTAKDHLAALLDQFDIPHSYVEGGQVIRVQQEPPADLYKTETRVGKK